MVCFGGKVIIWILLFRVSLIFKKFWEVFKCLFLGSLGVYVNVRWDK